MAQPARAAAAVVERLLGVPPLPADAACHAEATAAELKAMLASLPLGFVDKG